MAETKEYCIPNFIFQLIDNSGKPAAGAKIYTYESGTLLNKVTYEDAFGNAESTNPVVLDAYGRASIFGSGVYSIEVKAADGTTIVNKIDGIVFSSITGDADSTLLVLANYDAVRALNETPKQIYVQGRSVAGDGGQGLFALVASGADNDGSVLSCNSGSSFYKRIYDKYLDPQWFGVEYDNVSDQYIALISAIAASANTGDPLYINGSVTIAQNVTVPKGASIEFGDLGILLGSSEALVQFNPGTKLIGNNGCIGANITLQLVAGVCDSVNPNWWVGSDTYKLNEAAKCTKPESLGVPNVNGIGWGNLANGINHAPGNSIYGRLPINGYVSGNKYKLSFNVVRGANVEYAVGNNVVSTGWTGSWSTGYHHATGAGSNPLTVATTIPKLAATLQFTVSNIESGSVTAYLGGNAIGTYANDTTVSQSITPVANAGLVFTPTNDFKGDISAISLNVLASLVDNAINDMILTSTGWTGAKDAFTHTVGNTTPAVLTKQSPITAGSKITGSFDLARNAVEANVIDDSMITVNEWAGSVAAGWSPSIDNPGAGNAITGSFSISDITTKYKITIVATGINSGDVTLIEPVNIGPQTFKISANGTYTVIGTLEATNAINISLTRYQTGPQSIHITLSIVPIDIGSVIVTADSNPLILNGDPTVVAKEAGHYTFEYVPAADASVVAFTPTFDFDGTINNFSYAIENPGRVQVYAGTELIGEAKDGEYSFRYNGSTMYPFIELRPSLDFYGSLVDIAIDGISSKIPVKLTDAYSITGDIELGTLDPWGGSISVTSLSNISIDYLVDNRPTAWLSYDSIAYVGKVSIYGTAYPEHCDAKGDGTTDDAIAVKYALSNSKAEFQNNYLVKTAFSISNECDATGVGGTLIVDNVAVSLGSIYDVGLNITTQNSAALTFTSLDINGATITTGAFATLTTTNFNASLLTANLASKIANINAAIIDQSTFTSTSILKNPIKAIDVVASLTNSTLTGFTGFTVVNNAKIKDSSFVSANGYGFDVPANVSVYVTDTKAQVAILALFADSTGSLYARNVTGCDDAVSSSAVLGDRSIYSNLLSNGIGSVYEWESTILDSTNGNVKTMRTKLENKPTIGKVFSSKYVDHDYCLANGGEWQTGFTANDATVVTGGFQILGANDDNVHSAQCRIVNGYSDADAGRWGTQLLLGGVMELTITSPSAGFAKGAGLSFAYKYSTSNLIIPQHITHSLFSKVADLPITNSATQIKIKIPYWGGLMINDVSIHPGGRTMPTSITTLFDTWFEVSYKNLRDCVFDITYHPLLASSVSVANWYNPICDMTQFILIATDDPYYVGVSSTPNISIIGDAPDMPGSLVIRATNTLNGPSFINPSVSSPLCGIKYFINIDAKVLGALGFPFAFRYDPIDHMLYNYTCDQYTVDNSGDAVKMRGTYFGS